MKILFLSFNYFPRCAAVCYYTPKKFVRRFNRLAQSLCARATDELLAQKGN